MRRRQQVLDAGGIFADQFRGVPAPERAGCEVGIALAEARALLEELILFESIAEEADRSPGICCRSAGITCFCSCRDEIGKEPPVVPHPGLLREVDACLPTAARGPAQRVPGAQLQTHVPHAVGSAVGIAAFVTAPRARYVESERQQVLQPGTCCR